MATAKKYIYPRGNASMFFKCGTGSKMVTFRACPEGGYFVTDNPALQKGIESDELFNKSVFLDESSAPRTDARRASQKTDTTPETGSTSKNDPDQSIIPSPTQSLDGEGEGEKPEENNELQSTNTQSLIPSIPQSFPDITNPQQAKDIIRASFPDIEHQKLRTPDQIRKIAAEKNITFPNWID